jgi:hypothetical protein
VEEVREVTTQNTKQVLGLSTIATIPP